jgi:hypothetical protein
MPIDGVWFQEHFRDIAIILLVILLIVVIERWVTGGHSFLVAIFPFAKSVVVDFIVFLIILLIAVYYFYFRD